MWPGVLCLSTDRAYGPQIATPSSESTAIGGATSATPSPPPTANVVETFTPPSPGSTANAGALPVTLPDRAPATLHERPAATELERSPATEQEQQAATMQEQPTAAAQAQRATPRRCVAAGRRVAATRCVIAVSGAGRRMYASVAAIGLCAPPGVSGGR